MALLAYGHPSTVNEQPDKPSPDVRISVVISRSTTRWSYLPAV